MSSIFNIIYSNIYLILISIVISLVLYKFVKLMNDGTKYKDSKYINKLKENKRQLKKKLSLEQYCLDCTRDRYNFKFDKRRFKYLLNCKLHNSKLYYRDIKDKQSFFKYCYYINLHENKDDIHKLFLDNNMLTICKNTVSNCSAITSVILAECVTIKEKREFISVLLSYGFRITEKDILFAKLHVYESIPDITKNKILLFLKCWTILPEIAYYIINCLVNTYMIKHDPLLLNNKQLNKY